LEPSGPAFVIFTLSNGDYVQCAGSKDALVAEARLAASTSSPKHVRFGLGIRSGNKKTIHCNVGPIYVDETQVLRIEDAKAICREFIEHQGSLGTRFVAEDISDEQC